MGYTFPKNKFFQLKNITSIYLTLRSTNCLKIHLILYVTFANMYKSFFTTQLFCNFLAQRLHIFYNSSPEKCTFLDFPLLTLKFTKLLMSFFKQKVNFFFSKFRYIFDVIGDNSTVLFQPKFYMLLTKVAHQTANCQT